MEFQLELFQILKDDAVKVLHSICQQIWKTQQWPQDWKRSVFIPILKKGNAKECSNYRTMALISVQFSRSVTSDSLRSHKPQHARPPCPSPTPGVYSNSCALSWWCNPTISSSVVPFSSCLQSFPESGSSQMSQLFASGSQIIGGWISLESKRLSRVFSNTTVQKHQFFCIQLSL